MGPFSKVFQHIRLRQAVFILLALALLGYLVLAIFQAFHYTANVNTAPPVITPATAGLVYNEIAFPTATTDGVTLRGWWLPNSKSNRAIIFVHGRGGDRSSYQLLFKPLWNAGFNILAFDLRGHGQSDSAYCTWGINEQWDVVGAVNFVKSKGFQSKAIGVIGWSVGATTAIMAMRSDEDIKAAIVDSAYANSDPLLSHNLLYPGLVLALRVVRNIDINQIDPEKAIRQLGARHLLLIHGAEDKQVALSNLYRLQQAGGSSVSDTWIVPKAAHASAVYTDPDEYARRVIAFFNQELG